MCIACGGVCGGVGDVLLPSLVAGAGLMVLGVRAGRKRAGKRADESQSQSESTTSCYEADEGES